MPDHKDDPVYKAGYELGKILKIEREEDEKANRWDDTIEALRFCPRCGQLLELSVTSGQPACFLHGDFEVSEINDDQFRIEWKPN